MVFNSFQFLWLFPLIFVAYYLLQYLFRNRSQLSSRITNYLLIAVSYGVFMQWNPSHAFVLLGVTAVTFLFALLIEKKEAYGKRKYIVLAGTAITILPLLVFKYYNFINETVTGCLTSIGFAGEATGLNWAIPLGISFFTFQSLGYLLDVYHKRTKAEHNWWDYMLFVAFFPQIIAGPINKASLLLPQIKSNRTFDYSNAVIGLKCLLWGMFLKVSIADNLGITVDKIYDDYINQSGFSCLIASLCYTFQIYTDFSGYSLMALGVGKLLGFELTTNFRRPYLSISVTDFWRRWHISLSTWLKDYIYIPLGGSRCSKPRCYFNIFVTFLVSGIWHGANWTFILWGVLHGIFQIVEKMFGWQRYDGRSTLVRVTRIVITFSLVNFAWIFFRMPTLQDSFALIGQIFTPSNLPIIRPNIVVLSLILLLFIKETVEEFFPNIRIGFNSKKKYVRWVCYLAVIGLIIVFRVVDQSNFIYANF